MIFAIGFVLAASSQAQFHEISYPGAAFQGQSEHEDYDIYNGYLSKDQPGKCYCAVNFPDSANGMKVSRLSVTFMDYNSDSYLEIYLTKMDRWTGNITTVAVLSTYGKPHTTAIQYVNLPKSGMKAQGIDNNRYSWYLFCNFINSLITQPVSDIRLYSSIIRYE
jgi:hypothetical protein